MVIFGAGGDLTKRLGGARPSTTSHTARVLPEKFALIGVGHGDGTARTVGATASLPC